MAVTFLKSAETDQSGNPRCASKRWFLTEGRPVVRGYDRVKHWQPFVARADGIEDLSQILTRAERYSDLLAVRGAIRNASAHKQNINRRCRPRPNDEGPDLEDVPRCWVMIDLDRKPEPEGFDWILDPRRTAVWAAERYLPDGWADRKFHYQFGSSAGMQPGLSLHFWFWLDKPCTSRELKRTFETHSYGFDLSLYNPSQPHYTAAPQFIDLDDPLKGQRSGGVAMSRKDTLTLPEPDSGTDLDLQSDKPPQFARADLVSYREWTLDIAEAALRHISPDIEYPEWRNIASALIRLFGRPEAKPLFGKFSRGDLRGETSAKYDAARFEEQWQGFDTSAVTMGTVEYLAKKGGWNPDNELLDCLRSLKSCTDDLQKQQDIVDRAAGANLDPVALNAFLPVLKNLTGIQQDELKREIKDRQKRLQGGGAPSLKKGTADVLVEIGSQHELWKADDPGGQPFASLDRGKYTEHLPIDGNRYGNYLT